MLSHVSYGYHLTQCLMTGTLGSSFLLYEKMLNIFLIEQTKTQRFHTPLSVTVWEAEQKQGKEQNVHTI